MTVANITRVNSTSTKGFDDALQVGLRRAALTVRGITDLRIVEQSARVKNGTITEYCVGIEITFVLED
ncbi:MAG: dodecin domain-containing protein [Hyphomicrobiales bacterium]|nr:dodecin domain-containing protein [Hyphomicrobiales bacterium]